MLAKQFLKMDYILKHKTMKKLSRDEMKKVNGGNAPGPGCPAGYNHPRVRCMDGFLIDSTNNCRNSSNLCNNHGGFEGCYCLP